MISNNDCICNICQRGRRFDSILNHYLIHGSDREFMDLFHDYLLKIEFELEDIKRLKMELIMQLCKVRCINEKKSKNKES